MTTQTFDLSLFKESYSGTAAFSATGAFAPSGNTINRFDVALLTAFGSEASFTGSAVFEPSGYKSVTTDEHFYGEAIFTAAASLSASFDILHNGVAAFSGFGSFAASGVRDEQTWDIRLLRFAASSEGTVSFSGVGSLAASGTSQRYTWYTISADVVPRVVASGTASFSAVAAFSPNGSSVMSAPNFVAVGAFSADGLKSINGDAYFMCSAALTAHGVDLNEPWKTVVSDDTGWDSPFERPNVWVERIPTTSSWTER